MRLKDVDLIAELRELGRRLLAEPERFTGNIRVNAMEGGITNLNFEVSWRPANGGSPRTS